MGWRSLQEGGSSLPKFLEYGGGEGWGGDHNKIKWAVKFSKKGNLIQVWLRDMGNNVMWRLD